MTQPALHQLSVAFRAPVQCLSAWDGQVTGEGAQGFYCGDDRIVSRCVLTVAGHRVDHLTTYEPGGGEAVFRYAVRTPELRIDPGMMLERRRTVSPDGAREVLVLTSGGDEDVELSLQLELTADATRVDDLKNARGTATGTVDADGWHWRDEQTVMRIDRGGADLDPADGGLWLGWRVVVPARGAASVQWGLTARDDKAPFVATTRQPLVAPRVHDQRVQRLLDTSFADLDSLRMADRATPETPFFAAGAPWFFSMFGRDCLITARMLTPIDRTIGLDTLRAVAARQGSRTDVDMAEQPGKMLHEVRRTDLRADDPTPGPTYYYGSVDATPLWLMLFGAVARQGATDEELAPLLPAVRGCADWLLDHADADDDGFVEYVDESGHGLANQGWKDSGDSIRWPDGSLAQAPIALAEVQGYAFAAAGVAIDALRRLAPGDERLDRLAAFRDRIRREFRARFWVADERGRFPALALDADKRPVASAASNMGHLVGTGLLDRDEEDLVVGRLMQPDLANGYGIRTMSSDNAAYWPLSYHVGSVWTHDTGVIIECLLASGYDEQAEHLARCLLRAADGFGDRMPELFGGHGADEAVPPVPYPASCRPQAWAAASSVVVARALGQLR